MPLVDLFRAPAERDAFSDRALLAGMLTFEGALARALADAGAAPREAADTAGRLCDRWADDDAAFAATFDVDALARAGRTAGTLAIPFVRALTDAVAAEDAAAARCVHRGATSQDVIDTALVLEARRASRALVARLVAAADAAAQLAARYRDTPVIGRTLLQAAVPVSFGWKAAGWLASLSRCAQRLRRAADEGCVLQFGGAAGTLASLGERALPVADALAARLALPRPATSWHATRDGLYALAAEVGIACGALGKIGTDVALLMQSEVAEAFEPTGAGRGGSSAMPHKRNPVGSMLAREAAYRAPGLVATLLAQLPAEHERGLGSWQRDWFTFADLFGAASSGVDATVEVLGGLQVDAGRMLADVDALGGLPFAEALAGALAGALGRSAAQARVEALCRDAVARGVSLRDAFEQAAGRARAQNPHRAAAPHAAGAPGPDAPVPDLPELDAATLDAVFDPAHQLSGARTMTDAVLAQWHAQRPILLGPEST